MNNILIVIDMQNDFVTGTLADKEAEKIIPKIKERIERAKAEGDFVFFTKDTHDQDYLKTLEGHILPIEHCIKDTWGWEIVDELKPYAEYTYEKPTFGCVELAENLKGLYFNEIELIGTRTDICLLANAVLLKSFFPNKVIIIDDNYCAGTSKINEEIALRAMENLHMMTIWRNNK